VATEGSLAFLQTWYAAQSNGFWEHGRGITIESLATPGWSVTIDLEETALERKPMQRIASQKSSTDWIVCEIDHARFKGQGDPGKLALILQIFQTWAARDDTLE